MRKKERYEKVIAWFQKNVPVAKTELHYNNPYELLIAVILSAQCTDKRVNMITPPLYKDFPTPETLAATTPEVIFEYIRSVSYPNNKAKHLVGMAKSGIVANALRAVCHSDFRNPEPFHRHYVETVPIASHIVYFFLKSHLADKHACSFLMFLCDFLAAKRGSESKKCRRDCDGTFHRDLFVWLIIPDK